MNSPEVHKGSAEHSVEVQGAAHEQSEKLRKVESSQEHGIENQVESANKARHEAHEIISKDHSKEAEHGGEPTFGALRRITKSQKLASYKHTMKLLRVEMSTPAKTFSKFIHAPVIEKTSEVIGGSFARPNAILAGSTTALVLVTATYIIARTFGYRLSGFETIGSFILGWLIGLIYDYIRVMMLGRRS